MHAPDGFLNAGTAVATGALSVSVVGAALRHNGGRLADDRVPLAGMAAAFVFAAQMVNFPVASGTSGHLLGGALAAILLGPSLGLLVVTVVVVVQALIFADGGLTALGYNVFNMAIVTALGGYAVFRAARRILPSTAAGVVGASAIAGGASVVLSAMAFSVEWLFGATADIAFDTVFGAMVGVHLFIGIAEGVLTGMVVGAVLASRSDLVAGAADISPAQLRGPARVDRRGLVVAGVLVSLVLGSVVSQFAASSPDGLQRVAIDEGIAASGGTGGPSLFADYATQGLDNEVLSLAVAGMAGVLIVLTVGFGLFASLRRQTRRPAVAAVGDR
jgi:cobalt/nickel transport system permease protein